MSKIVCVNSIDEKIVPPKKRLSLKLLAKTKIWMMRKISPADREKLRNSRNEHFIILQRCKLRSFQYIIKHSVKSKIFFGSTIERETLPPTGPAVSPLMRRVCGNKMITPGPERYNIKSTLIKKLPTKSGSSPFTDKLPLFFELKPTTKVPPIGTYDIYKKPIVQQKPPFRCDISKGVPKLETPGPGSYTLREKIDNRMLSFGGKILIKQAVKIICSPKNESMCKICGEQPLGDYYHNPKKNEDICRACMIIEIQLSKKCGVHLLIKQKKKKELLQFILARYCGFYHDHSGTRAAIKLMTKREVKEKFRVENYLSKFV